METEREHLNLYDDYTEDYKHGYPILALPARYATNKKRFVEDFRETGTIQQQEFAVKRILKLNIPDEIKYRFLADLLFIGERGHPVRELIIRTINNLTASETNPTIEAIKTAVKKAVNYKIHLIENLNDDREIVIGVLSLADCFTKFPVGLEALTDNYKRFVNLVSRKMSMYYKFLRNENVSEAKRYQYNQHINELTWTFCWCIHEFPTVVVDWAEELQGFVRDAFFFINDTEASFDIRYNVTKFILDVSNQMEILEEVLSVGLTYKLEQRLPMLMCMLGVLPKVYFKRSSLAYVNICTTVIRMAQSDAEILYAVKSLDGYACFLREIKLVGTPLEHAKLILRLTFLFGIWFLDSPVQLVINRTTNMLRNLSVTLGILGFFDLIDYVYGKCSDMDLSTPALRFMLHLCTWNDVVRDPLSYYKLCNKMISSIENDEPDVEDIYHGFCALSVFVRKIRDSPMNGVELQVFMHLKLTLRNILLVTIKFLEYSAECIRYVSSDLITGLMLTAKHLDFPQLSQKVYEACNKETLSLQSKRVLLQNVSIAYGIKDVIINCRKEFLTAFSDRFGRDREVDYMYEDFIISTYDAKNFFEWVISWINFIMGLLEDKERVPYVQKLLKNILHIDSRIPSIIIGRTELKSDMKLSILFSNHKSELEMDCGQGYMKTFIQLFRDAIINSRISSAHRALEIILNSKCWNEDIHDFRWECFLTFIDYQANIPESRIRNKSYELLKKAIALCGEQGIDDNKKRKKRDRHNFRALFFLKYLTQGLLSNLYCGLNFSRQNLVLRLLHDCVDLCYSLKMTVTIILPENSILQIFSSIGDDDENNCRAIELLKKIELQKPYSDLIEEYKLPVSLTSIKALLRSINPLHVVIGTHRLDLFCNRPRKEVIWDIDTCPPTNSSEYMAINWCLNCLLNPQRDTLKSKFGLLFAIRFFLLKLDSKIIRENKIWLKCLCDLQKICQQLMGGIKKQAPLPCDIKNMQLKDPCEFFYDYQYPQMNTNQQSYKFEDEQASRMFITKLLLTVAWRSVKETVILLSTLIKIGPIKYAKLPCNVDSSEKEYVFMENEILQIGERFINLLETTRHPVVFKCLFISLSDYCKHMWSITDSLELNKIPMKWLNASLDYISQMNATSDEQVIRTIPYLIQAIVTTELEYNSSKSLEKTFDSLLENCNDHSEKAPEKRIWSMHIMRHLLRSHILNGKINKYIGPCLITAINAYDREDDIKKYSASMLFKELTKRIFHENYESTPITSTEFFERSPTLYDYLSDELNTICSLVPQSECPPKLMPILVLLNHIIMRKPPSNKDFLLSHRLNIYNFVPMLIACFGHKNYIEREAIANLLVSLVPEKLLMNKLYVECSYLLKYATEKPKAEMTSGRVHGVLFQILLFIRRIRYHPTDLIKYIIESLFQHSMASNLINSYILKETYQILSEMFARLNYTAKGFNKIFVMHDLEMVKYFIRIGPIVKYMQGNNIGLQRAYEDFVLHCFRLMHPEEYVIMYFVDILSTINAVPLGPSVATLNVALMFLYDTHMKEPKVDDEFFQRVFLKEFECNDVERSFYNQASPVFVSKVTSLIGQNIALRDQLLALLDFSTYNQITSKCLAILSMMGIMRFKLMDLVEKSKFYEDKIPVTMCIIRYVQEIGVGAEQWPILMGYALDFICKPGPIYLRYKLAKLLYYIEPYFHAQVECFQFDIIGQYAQLVLTLLSDRCEEVRIYTAKVVYNQIKNHSDIRKFVNWSDFNKTFIYGISDDSIVPTLTQQLFLQYIADVLHDINAPDNILYQVISVIIKPFLNLPSHYLNRGFDSKVEYPSENYVDAEKSRKDASTNVAREIDGVTDEEKRQYLLDMRENNYAEPMRIIVDTVLVFRRTFCDRKELLERINNNLKGFMF